MARLAAESHTWQGRSTAHTRSRQQRRSKREQRTDSSLSQERTLRRRRHQRRVQRCGTGQPPQSVLHSAEGLGLAERDGVCACVKRGGGGRVALSAARRTEFDSHVAEATQAHDTQLEARLVHAVLQERPGRPVRRGCSARCRRLRLRNQLGGCAGGVLQQRTCGADGAGPEGDSGGQTRIRIGVPASLGCTQ